MSTIATSLLQGHGGVQQGCSSRFNARNEPAVFQVQDSICLAGDFVTVCHHDYERSQLTAQLIQESQDLVSSRPVQVPGGLIRQDNRGMQRQGTRQGDPLLFTA